MALDESDLARMAQRCFAATPVMVLGTGASMQYGVAGMPQLRTELQSALPSSPMASDAQIKEFLHALEHHDVERALTDVQLTEIQEREVVRRTWELVARDDLDLFMRIAGGAVTPQYVQLFQHLFRTTRRELDVVTTNYDRLAEYCANIGGYGSFNGFADGYIGRRWADAPTRACRLECKSAPRNRVVRIWKLHGSLDWFAKDSGAVHCFPSASSAMLREWEPQIVTPGTTKYERTHAEPFRTVFAQADRALSCAESFLCVGYGFNDKHIHPKLTERARVAACPVVVLARELTQSAIATLRTLGPAPYLACERGFTNDTSRVYTSAQPDGEEVARPNLWQLADFMKNYVLS